MISLKKIANIAALGCLGFCLTGLVACLEEDPVSQNGNNYGDDPSKPPVDPNTGKPMAGQEIEITYRDSVTGNIVTKIDTFFVPADTTLRWVGNSALRITEIAPVNLDWLDEDGGDPGWVEIYNAGSDTANLKNYTLVENLENARKWYFGNVKIAPKGFITVFCDKKDVKESPVDLKDTNGAVIGHGRPHTNWKLEKDKGVLYLVDPFYGIRDSVAYPELTAGMSWGIVDGGVWKYFDKPTPEKPNTKSTAYDGVAPTFTFSGAEGGFYDGEVVLNAPKTSDGLKVRCTQDGSAPTKDSPEFNQTITISHNTVLRCAAFKDGLLTNKVVTNTYFIGEMVKMPVVAVSVDPSFFVKYYKKTNGGEPDMDGDQMYAPNKAYPNDPGEMPVHVEYFENGSSSKGKAWEIDASISLMGGWSRMERKKSVSIKMSEEYQAGWLNYPLFKTRESTSHKFKAFNLRNNGNRFVSDYFADAAGGALLEGSDVDYQRSRQVVVFYNGTYYGIHDMRERYNKNYVESNYGIDAGSVNFIKHLGKEITASSGTVDNYLAMLAFIIDGDMSNPTQYAAAKTLLDVGSYADYMAAEIYMHNGDWPNNNVRAWRAPEHPWKFMIYDLDHGFDWKWSVSGFDEYTNMFKWVKQGGRAEGSNKCHGTPDNHCFHMLYNSLMKSAEFKRMFINRSAVMLQNYLNAENMTKQVDFLAGMLNEFDVARDMDVEAYAGRRQSYGSFDPYGKKLPKWAAERDQSIMDEYKSEFSLTGTATVTIVANGKGSVEMEGMKLPSSSYKGKFFAGNGILLEAKAGDGAMFAGWSDGVADPVRIVDAVDGATYTANFK